MNKIPEINIDSKMLEDWIMTISKAGHHGETGVWRTLYSPEWVEATNIFSNWVTEAGLACRMDGVGNVWGTLKGEKDSLSIVSGSHIDTQCPGGRYDGTLGILTALAAIKSLKEQFGEPKKTLEVVALCEEEASRFPSANFWGSRGITGAIDPDEVFKLKDFDGITMHDAMQSVGLDPNTILKAKRTDIDCFIELHIEQGPILENSNSPVGIVDAITGVRQSHIWLKGEANHAGAFPMDLRRDPMACFAEISNALISAAEQRGRPSVLTIGSCSVKPNRAGIIPSEVFFTIDCRHPDPEILKKIHQDNEEVIRQIASRRDITVEMKTQLDKVPCVSAPRLLQVIDTAAQTLTVKSEHIISGAGHDSQQMAKICDVAMIFVQSKDGRSHTQEEYSSIEHIVEGTKLLAKTFYALAY